MRIGIIAVSLILVLAGPLAVRGAPARNALCLRQDMVRGWKVPDDDTLIVTGQTGRKFRLSLAGACHDLQFVTSLSFKRASADASACLARNDTVAATLPGYPPQICRITQIEDYTEAMENADEAAEASLYHHPDTKASIGAIP